MSDTDFQEDGCGRFGEARYGHRHEAGCVGHDSYGEDRLTGCSYEATDDPGMTVPEGCQYEMHLEFRGKIVEVDADGNELKTKQTIKWEINCRGIAGQ